MTFSVERLTLALALHDQTTPSLAELPGDVFGSRRVVGEGVVVEEELLDLREGGLGPADFLDHVADAAGSVAVAAHGLRPEAEGAARFAAPPGIEGQIGVLEIADEVVFDLEVALVDGRDERQKIHVFEHGPLGVADDDAGLVAPSQTGYGREVPSLRDLFDGEVEFVARDKIHDRRGFEALVALDRHLCAD